MWRWCSRSVSGAGSGSASDPLPRLLQSKPSRAATTTADRDGTGVWSILMTSALALSAEGGKGELMEGRVDVSQRGRATTDRRHPPHANSWPGDRVLFGHTPGTPVAVWKIARTARVRDLSDIKYLVVLPHRIELWTSPLPRRDSPSPGALISALFWARQSFSP